MILLRFLGLEQEGLQVTDDGLAEGKDDVVRVKPINTEHRLIFNFTFDLITLAHVR